MKTTDLLYKGLEEEFISMGENDLEVAKKFLVSYLKDRVLDYDCVHPWRNSWEFIVLHSFRVEGYVKKILENEKHNLSQEEVLLTRLGAILHDVGRIHRREHHALLGKEIVQAWLSENENISNTISDKNRLLYLIEKHSNKEEDTEDYCLQILRDADVLDEIGAMSIFMTSTWIDKSSPYFFKLLKDRIESFEINFCNEGFKLLNTEAAKVILEQKKAFISNFVNVLKDELYGTEDFGEVSIEDYFEK
jgi:uncharacterized protein